MSDREGSMFEQRPNHFQESYMTWYQALSVTSAELQEAQSDYAEWQDTEEAMLLSKVEESARAMAAYDVEHGIMPRYKPATPAMDATTETALPQSGGLSRIRWKGSKADLGRVYAILGSKIDCTGADWERHFTGPAGESMQYATDIHNGNPVGKTSEMLSLAKAVSRMKPDPE